jgi:hypothetical protein
MNSFKDRKLVVAFSGAFKKQSAFGVPLATVDIDTRHPQTTKVYPGRQVSREETRDCTGEYIVKEEITSRLTRFAFGFDADARLLAGWLAYAMGAAAAPAGTQTAEVWSIAVTGTPTLGYLTVNHTFNGLTDSVDIPYNATNAEIKRLLESLRTIKPGNIASVTGTLLAGPIVITLGGKLAAGDIAQPTTVDTNLTGATTSVSTTTAGTSKTAAIARTTLDQTPLFSIIVGFEGDTTNPDKYKDMIVNSVTIRGAIKAKVTVELELLGSADLGEVIGYVMPACVNQDVIYTKDCRIEIDGIFEAANLREFTYNFNNNAFTDDDPFPYDDIDIVRLEHGDRTSEFTLGIYGSKGDVTFNKAEAEMKVPVNMHIGPPVSKIVVNAPKTHLKLGDDPITFAGEALRSAFNVTGTPHYDSLTPGTPDNVIYYGPETGTLLGV